MNIFLPLTQKTIEYCKSCTLEKEAEQSEGNSCKWEEKKCKNKAQESGYCGKHEPRSLLLQEAKEKGVRICDDGKRSCKNKTMNGKLKCEDCLEKTRLKEQMQYNQRKDSLVCLTCGKELSELHTGLRGHKIQKCESCYDKWRSIEEARIRERNYSSEKRLNLAVAHRSHQDTASRRGLVSLDYEVYCDLITKPCAYCGKYNELEVIGVDRINSSKGYTLDNCTPCCEDCNRAKGELSYEEFKAFILRVANFMSSKSEDTTSLGSENNSEQIEEKSRLRPHKIYEYYIRKKFQIFIKYCEEDNRTISFIEKMKEIHKLPTMLDATEFKRQLRNALFIEERSLRKTSDGERKRIPRKELFQLFENNKIDDAIKLYSRVFGESKENLEDMKFLGENWPSYPSEQKKKEELERIIIRFQNRRNKH